MRVVASYLCVLALAAPLVAERLDEGMLDPSWFGGSPEFRATEEIDYLWAAPGLDLKGATIRIAEWEDPKFLGKDRDAKDKAKAVELTDRWPSWLRGALSAVPGITTTKEGGDYVLQGRLVDCNAGSKAAKHYAGNINTRYHAPVPKSGRWTPSAELSQTGREPEKTARIAARPSIG